MDNREGDGEETQSSKELTNKNTNTNARKQTIQMSCILHMSRDAFDFEALCHLELKEGISNKAPLQHPQQKK